MCLAHGGRARLHGGDRRPRRDAAKGLPQALRRALHLRRGPAGAARTAFDEGARLRAAQRVRAVRRGCEGRLRLHGDRRAERPGQGDLEARASLWHGDRRPGVLRGAAGHRRDAPRRCRDVLRRDPRARHQGQGGARAGHQARRLRRLHAQGRRPGRPGCRRRLVRAARG